MDNDESAYWYALLNIPGVKSSSVCLNLLILISNISKHFHLLLQFINHKPSLTKKSFLYQLLVYMY